jgi:exportin-T
MDSVLVVDPSLVTGAVQTLAMNTLNAYQSGAAVKWNDAELAVYLVYIFGEINKCEPVSSWTDHWLIFSR